MEFGEMMIDYVREREGAAFYITDYGFIKYVIDKDTIYMQEIYVAPEHRHGNLSGEMANELINWAKTRGCKKMLGSCVPSTNNAHKSMVLMIAFGMKLHMAMADKIFFIKEIG